MVPADGHPGAGLAAGAGEGEVAWFAPVFPVAAPLGEPQGEAGLEPVLGGGDGGVRMHCVCARLCTCVCAHGCTACLHGCAHVCAPCVHGCVHMCICMCHRGRCHSPPPPPAPAHLGTLVVPPGRGEGCRCPGTEATRGAPGFTLRGWGRDPPQPAPPAPAPAATNPLSGVALFSLEAKQRCPISTPLLPTPRHSAGNTRHGAVWSWCQHCGVAAANTMAVPSLPTPAARGAHCPGSPWGPVARPIRGALRGVSRTGRRGRDGVSMGAAPCL